MTKQEREKLRELAAQASKGEWSVYSETISNSYAAAEEFQYQVSHTEGFVGRLYMLNAEGKCPAITGCGPTSEANANYLASAYPERLLALLDHIDALEGQAADVIACWGKLYPDADARKLGITQDELEDMEFGPVNKLRKAIASAPEVR